MGQVVGFVLFYIVAMPMIGIGSILGIYGGYLDYLDAQERFSVLGLDSIYWAFGLVLVGSISGMVKLLLENRKLYQKALSPEAHEHHSAIIAFIINEIGIVDLLPAGTFRLTHLNAFGKDNDIPGGKVDSIVKTPGRCGPSRA